MFNWLFTATFETITRDFAKVAAKLETFIKEQENIAKTKAEQIEALVQHRAEAITQSARASATVAKLKEIFG